MIFTSIFLKFETTNLGRKYQYFRALSLKSNCKKDIYVKRTWQGYWMAKADYLKLKEYPNIMWNLASRH